MGIALIHCGMCQPHQRKIPKTFSQLLQVFSMENSGVINIRYQPTHKMFSNLINILVTRSIKTRSFSRTLKFFQTAGC